MIRALLASMVVLVAVAGACGTDAPPPTGETDGGACPVGSQSCGDECVDLDSDPSHCGSCDHDCPEDARFCVHGTCHDDCGPLARCDDECVSLSSDPEHCGSCDRACQDDAPVCGGGECFARCPDGVEPCGAGECPDTQTDPRHCGGCGIACSADERCQGGSCVTDRPCVGEGLTECDGRCVDLQTDEDYCGTCAVECERGDSCVDGGCTCLGGGCEPCGVGERDCDPTDEGRACRDLETDESACGDCNRACEAGQECVGGECRGECGGGEATSCDGQCVDLESDPDHCGDCDVACEGGQECIEGECAGVVPTECDSCPCEDCPAREDPPQRCCEDDGEVVCVATDECPEH